MSETLRRDGGRVVELFVPVEWMKATFAQVEIKPPTWDQLIRWNDGEFKSPLQLLAELSGMPETKLRAITTVDIQRVMMAFLAVVPPSIADDINNGRVPKREPPAAVEQADDDSLRAGNGATMPIDDSPGFDVAPPN